jgi:hypothetical protein
VSTTDLPSAPTGKQFIATPECGVPDGAGVRDRGGRQPADHPVAALGSVQHPRRAPECVRRPVSTMVLIVFSPAVTAEMEVRSLTGVGAEKAVGH